MYLQGASVAEHMLLGVDGECTAEGADRQTLDIRSNIFEKCAIVTFNSCDHFTVSN